MKIDWPTASVIIGISLLLGQLLRDFLSGKYSKDGREYTKHDLRIKDDKWKTSIFVKLGELITGQNEMKENVNRFKDDVQKDVNSINDRIDNMHNHLTARIDRIKHN